MAELRVFNLGDIGVDVVQSPLHLEEGALVSAQNAVPNPIGQGHGVSKRQGMIALTDALDGSVLAFIVAGLTLSNTLSADDDSFTQESQAYAAFLDLFYMRCRLYLSAATTSINDNSETAISWDSEDFDVGNLHDVVTNPERITIPTGGDGLYLVVGQVKWATSASGKKRGLRVYVDATLNLAHDGAADDDGDGMTQQVAGLVNLTAGQYLTLKVEQDTGGALDIEGSSVNETSFMCTRLVAASSTPLPFCQIYKGSNQAITGAYSVDVITFDSEALDTHSMHDAGVNPSRITIPSGQPGKYAVVGQFNLNAVIGFTYAQIRKNGTQILASTSTYQATSGQVAGVFDMAAGDYFELILKGQAAGASAIGSGGLEGTTLTVARVG